MNYSPKFTCCFAKMTRSHSASFNSHPSASWTRGCHSGVRLCFWRCAPSLFVVPGQLRELLREVLLGLVPSVLEALKVVLYELVRHLAGFLQSPDRDAAAQMWAEAGLQGCGRQTVGRQRMPDFNWLKCSTASGQVCTSGDRTSMFSCATYLQQRRHSNLRNTILLSSVESRNAAAQSSAHTCRHALKCGSTASSTLCTRMLEKSWLRCGWSFSSTSTW